MRNKAYPKKVVIENKLDVSKFSEDPCEFCDFKACGLMCDTCLVRREKENAINT